MSLVPTSNNHNNAKNPSAEKVCDMLQEVLHRSMFFLEMSKAYLFSSLEIRDEFRTLKSYVAKQQQSGNADNAHLTDVLNRAEHTVKVIEEFSNKLE